MTTHTQVAAAFAAHKTAKAGTASTDGRTYFLHGHPIAYRRNDGTVEVRWCGYWTQTTARHLNAVLAACGARERVSAAQARKDGQTGFVASV